MISRRTVVMLLLAVLLGLGLRLWATGTRDDCDRFGPGTRVQPTSIKVASGSQTFDLPCAPWTWPLRQGHPVQGLLLLDAVLFGAALVNLFSDWGRRRERQKATT